MVYKFALIGQWIIGCFGKIGMKGNESVFFFF
jgi:hypothetical protein